VVVADFDKQIWFWIPLTKKWLAGGSRGFGLACFSACWRPNVNWWFSREWRCATQWGLISQSRRKKLQTGYLYALWFVMIIGVWLCSPVLCLTGTALRWWYFPPFSNVIEFCCDYWRPRQLVAVQTNNKRARQLALLIQCGNHAVCHFLLYIGFGHHQPSNAVRWTPVKGRGHLIWKYYLGIDGFSMPLDDPDYEFNGVSVRCRWQGDWG